MIATLTDPILQTGPSGRPANWIAPLGDSRAAAVFLDPNALNYGARSPLNAANARSGQRYIIPKTYGISGQRTDQILLRADAAIDSPCGVLYLQGFLNNVAALASAPSFRHAYTNTLVTLSNVAQIGFQDTGTIMERARAAGMLVVVEMEVGAENLTSPQVNAVIEYNARLLDYAQNTPGIYLHDARRVVLKTDFSDTLIQYKANFAPDGTHTSPLGADYWGESLSLLLNSIIPQMPSMIPSNRYDLPANNRWQLELNPLFLGSAGTLSGGATGFAPTSWTLNQQAAGPTVVGAMTTDASGFGQNLLVDVSNIDAAGRSVRLFQDVTATNYQPGDIVQAVAEVAVDGASGGAGNPDALAGLWLQLNQDVGGAAGASAMSMLYGDTAEYGIDRPGSFTLATKPVTIQAVKGTNPFLTMSIRAISRAASVPGYRIRIKRAGMIRRLSTWG